MKRRELGPRALERLREELTGRDIAIIGQVADLRLMNARQLQAVHFSEADHASPAAAVRACGRCLERLTACRLLTRLERRVGGIRAGSAAHCYVLGPVGERVLRLEGPRRRHREPSTTFALHTLAIGQLVVDFILAARDNRLELLTCQTEPRCWRQFSGIGGGTTVLRPDLFVALGVDELEWRWFCEIDRGTAHIPAVLRKCHVYETYRHSGREQAEHGSFPLVCWIVPNELRAEQLRQAIDRDRQLTRGLYVVTTTERAIAVLSGATP